LTDGAYDDLTLLLVILVVVYLLIRAENNAPSAASGCSGQVLENHQQLHKLVLTTGCAEAG
jgi:hypothetical protein